MKSGQAEIMGLILITVIAGLVLAFALVYLSSNVGKQELAHQKFAEKGLSANFVTVLSKTYVDSCAVDFEILVRDCASEFDNTDPDWAIEEFGKIGCLESGNRFSSCEALRKTSSEIISKTLDVWGVKYNLTILKGNEEIIEISDGCSAEAEREAPGRQIVPLYPLPEQAFIMLQVCK